MQNIKNRSRQRVYGGPLVTVPDSLYSYSYPGEPDYISPRCSQCIEKAIKEKWR